MYGKFHTPLSQGNYFLPKSHNLFKEKKRLSKTALAAKIAIFFNWFLVLVR